MAATSSPPPSAAHARLASNTTREMVELSRANAKKAGVADRATFVEGDMFEADISKATALVLFLLPATSRS